MPELVERLKDFSAKIFAPPHMSERGLTMTGGGQAALYTIMQAFVDRGDYVFAPEITYSSFLSIVSGVCVAV